MENSLRLLNCLGLMTIFRQIFFFLNFIYYVYMHAHPWVQVPQKPDVLDPPGAAVTAVVACSTRVLELTLDPLKEQYVFLTAKPTAQAQFSHLHCSEL